MKKESSGLRHCAFLDGATVTINKRDLRIAAVKDTTTISEMNGMDENNLKLWTTSILAKDKKSNRKHSAVFAE